MKQFVSSAPTAPSLYSACVHRQNTVMAWDDGQHGSSLAFSPSWAQYTQSAALLNAPSQHFATADEAGETAMCGNGMVASKREYSKSTQIALAIAGLTAHHCRMQSPRRIQCMPNCPLAGRHASRSHGECDIFTLAVLTIIFCGTNSFALGLS